MIGPSHSFWRAHRTIIKAGYHPFASVFLTDHELKQIPGMGPALIAAWREMFEPWLARNARRQPHSVLNRKAGGARRWHSVHIAHARDGQ